MFKYLKSVISLIIVVGVLAGNTFYCVKAEENHEHLSSIIDFSALIGKDNPEIDKETVLSAGAFAVSNIRIGGYYGNLGSPGGYTGVGYYTQGIVARQGEVLDNVNVEFTYTLTSPDNGSSPSYVKTLVSFDNENWEQNFYSSEKISGKKRICLNINKAIGKNAVYIKFEMKNWGSYDGASIECSKITADSQIKLYGDVNKDGIINSVDLIHFEKGLLKNSLYGNTYDINQDGVINIVDIISMKKKTVKSDKDELMKKERGSFYFGNSLIEGVESTSSDKLTVKGMSNTVSVKTEVGDYNTEYSCRTLEECGSELEFEIKDITPDKDLSLIIEEIHKRNDSRIAYYVYINGKKFYYRTYEPNSDGANNVIFDIPAYAVGKNDKMTVKIISNTDNIIRFHKVNAVSGIDELAEKEGIFTKMQVALMLNEVPSNLNTDYLINLLNSYKCNDMYEIGLCWEIQYMAWGKEKTEKYLDNVIEASIACNAPLYLGINSWWSGTPIGMDGLGGSWQDLTYQQIAYKPENNSYALSTPNVWGNTPWHTMNNKHYNEARKQRIKETVEYIQMRTAKAYSRGEALSDVHLYTENEPIYWPINWFYYDNNKYPEGIGDFSPYVVADAKKDGVVLDPSDGLDSTEKEWMFRNLNTYISDVGEAMAKGLSSNYIIVKNGELIYPKNQTSEKSYTHSPIQAIYPNWDQNKRAWENHILKTLHFGGEWNQNIKDKDNESILGDTRAFDYITAYGSYADINCEREGIPGTTFGVLPQSYSYGLEGVVIYNVRRAEDQVSVKEQSGKMNDKVSVKQYPSNYDKSVSGRTDGSEYTLAQMRLRQQMIAARADAERLLSSYYNKNGNIIDDIYKEAYELYREYRYGTVIRLLSKEISKILPADYLVSGYGRLGEYPISVNTPFELGIRLLDVSFEKIRFKIMSDIYDGVKISLLTDSGSYSLIDEGDGYFTVTKGEKPAFNGSVTFTLSKERAEETFEGMAISSDFNSIIIQSQNVKYGQYSGGVEYRLASDVKVYRAADGTVNSKMPRTSAINIAYGDKVCVKLNANKEIFEIYATYGTVSGTVTAVEEAVITGEIKNPYFEITSNGVKYRFEIGGECELRFNGATAERLKLAPVGNIGLKFGQSVTVQYSPYYTNGRIRALIIS